MRIPKLDDGVLVEVLTCAGLVTGKWRATNDKSYIVLNSALYANSDKAVDAAFIDVNELIRVKQITGVKGIPVFSDADKIHAHALGVAL